MTDSFLFIGTGGAAGVPIIGCECPVCTSSDPLNKRLRPSGLLTAGGKRLLIDVGPDFREQALKYKINYLDGVLLTHSHFDHVAGLDELRVYFLIHHVVMPVLVSKHTHKELKKRYYYLFAEKSWGTSLAAQLNFHMLDKDRGEIEFIDTTLRYMSYEQGGMTVNGYRYKNFAYISDIRKYPETILEDLAGVEVLVLSAVGVKPSPMHFTLNEAVSFARQVGAKRTYLTHLSHRLDHAHTNDLLPEGVELAHDGLELEIG